MDIEDHNIYEFGPFCLIPKEHHLLCGEEVIPLKPKAFDLLVVLVQNSGHLVTKDELMRQVWPDTAIEENNLNVNISLLRKALQSKEGSAQEEYIKTIHRRGYRFVAEVKISQGSRTDLELKEEGLDEHAVELSRQPLPDEEIGRDLNEMSDKGGTRRRITIGRPHVILVLLGLLLLLGILTYVLLSSLQKPPQINSVAIITTPSPGRQFIIRIDGDGFDPDAVQVIVTGPGCKKFGSCTVPNEVLHNFGSVTITQIENVPLTIGAGENQIFVQNGPKGAVSNGLIVTVPDKK